MDGYWILLTAFPASTEMITWFFFLNLLLDYFDIEPSLHSWDKTYLYKNTVCSVEFGLLFFIWNVYIYIYIIPNEGVEKISYQRMELWGI